MKNKLIFLVMIALINGLVIAQEIIIQENAYINYPNMMYEFKNNQTRFWSDGTIINNGKDEIDLMGTYKIEYNEGINFIEFNWENNTKEKFLILYNDYLCYLYKNDGRQDFRGYRLRGGVPGESSLSVSYSAVNIKSSSFLTENNIEYSPDNLNEEIGICWAEGVSGQGINETLYLQGFYQTNSIHISNGFVSYSKPYLYKQNSRLKKIELSVENKYTKIIELIDTPNFQTINLSETLLPDEILKIKILEVYPGNKYEDTCVNIILMDGNKY